MNIIFLGGHFIIIYIISIFALANLYYFLFSCKEKKTWKKTMQSLFLIGSIMIIIVAAVLSTMKSDRLIVDARSFFLFLLITNAMLLFYLLFLLMINNTVDRLILFVKSYGTYTFVFSLTAFFGIPLVTFILYGFMGFVFRLE